MKAIRVHQFGDPSVMKLEEVPDRSADAGQVVVDVKAVGVNPVDTYIRSGQYAFLPPLPYTPGSDAAGVVWRWVARCPTSRWATAYTSWGPSTAER